MSADQKIIQRVLIANRSEIAVRIIRAARDLNIETVAVYSEADEGALHVRMADRKIALRGYNAKETYLNADKLINSAIQSNCDAVHPGYGFFAENADFASAVLKAGIRFIGPPPKVIALMGDKHQAREQAINCKVPVVPGTKVGLSLGQMKEFANEIGYPVMIKAIAGGSGRGMRLVESPDELEPKLQEAQAEAESAFKNSEVILEKCILRPRHIEIQIFGDEQGNVLHFGERECSLQRRHQKLVEEAPAPRFHPALREKMLKAAISLVKTIGYVGAGTLEFLVEGGDSEESPFYFLEMNTRIQVEHPVTEAVTGIDLVKLQFLVASGQAINFKQKDIKFSGHALEYRVYGEDTTRGFLPVTGVIKYILRPSGPGVREDSWVEAGTKISPYYDSLLSKLIIWGRNREEALSRSRRALSEFHCEGFETTLGFHRWLLEQKDFLTAEVDIKWIENRYQGQRPSAHTVGPFSLPPLLMSPK